MRISDWSSDVCSSDRKDPQVRAWLVRIPAGPFIPPHLGVLVIRIQRLMPASDGGDDGVGIGGPGEGLGFGVVLAHEAVDGGLEVDDGVEDAALEPSPGELGEEAFDSIEPGAGGRDRKSTRL